MEQTTEQPINEQEVCGFLNCAGQIFVFSEHLTPSGKQCVPTGSQRNTGILFNIDPFDRRNKPNATALFGNCGACKSKLVMPRSKLSANG